MTSNVYGLIVIAIGLCVIALRNWLVRESLDAQYRLFGLRFNDQIVRLNYILTPIVGLIIVIYGGLILLGVAK